MSFQEERTHLVFQITSRGCKQLHTLLQHRLFLHPSTSTTTLPVFISQALVVSTGGIS